MSSETLKTVRIVRPECPGGFVEINEADFNENKHEVFVDSPDTDIVKGGKGGKRGKGGKIEE